MPFDDWPMAPNSEEEPGSYPHFIPPGHLANKRWKDWTGQEAQAFLAWLLDEMPARLAGLFSYFDVVRTSDADELLRRIGAQVETALKTREFAHEARVPGEDAIGRLLTNRGYALGADLGFLVASLLAERLGGKVEWTIFRKTRRWAPHNHPILRSRVVACDFDMIACGLAGCFGILDGTRNGAFWAELFAVWHNLLLYNDARGLSMNPAERSGTNRGER